MNLFRSLLSVSADRRRQVFERLVREESARQFARRAARIPPVASLASLRRAAEPALRF